MHGFHLCERQARATTVCTNGASCTWDHPFSPCPRWSTKRKRLGNSALGGLVSLYSFVYYITIVKPGCTLFAFCLSEFRLLFVLGKGLPVSSKAEKRKVEYENQEEFHQQKSAFFLKKEKVDNAFISVLRSIPSFKHPFSISAQHPPPGSNSENPPLWYVYILLYYTVV